MKFYIWSGIVLFLFILLYAWAVHHSVRREYICHSLGGAYINSQCIKAELISLE